MDIDQRQEAWRELIGQQAASGQSIRVWCEQNGIKEGQYYSWKARLFPKVDSALKDTGQAAAGQAAMQSVFIPVDLPLTGGLSVSFGKDIRMEVSGECNVEHLRATLEIPRGSVRCWR